MKINLSLATALTLGALAIGSPGSNEGQSMDIENVEAIADGDIDPNLYTSRILTAEEDDHDAQNMRTASTMPGNLTEEALDKLNSTISPEEFKKYVQQMGGPYDNFLLPVIYQSNGEKNLSKVHMNQAGGWWSHQLLRDIEVMYNTMLQLHGVESNISYQNSWQMRLLKFEERFLIKRLKKVAESKRPLAGKRLKQALMHSKKTARFVVLMSVQEAMQKLPLYYYNKKQHVKRMEEEKDNGKVYNYNCEKLVTEVCEGGSKWT